MSLYSSPETSGKTSNPLAEFSHSPKDILNFIKSRPIWGFAFLALIGSWPYLAIHTENPFESSFLLGFLFYLAYIYLLLSAAVLIYRGSTQKKFIFILFALAGARFSLLIFSALDIGINDYLPKHTWIFFESTASLALRFFHLFYGYQDALIIKISMAIAIISMEIAIILFFIKTSIKDKDSPLWGSRFFSFPKKYFFILLTTFGITLILPLTVKLNLIGYEAQIRYLGIPPGTVKITTIGHITPYSCRTSIALSIKDVAKWGSANVTISGRNSDNLELFRETQEVRLDEYDFKDFAKPQYNCDGLSYFVIESVDEYKSQNLSNQEAKIREKYFSYHLDEKYKEKTVMSNNMKSDSSSPK